VPYDLQAVERGFGECDVPWQGSDILVRYRADLNNRALIAMKRVMVGVLTLDGVTRFPDVEAIIDELLRTLLPSGPDVPEDERGWDVTAGGASVPITFDTLVDLPPGLPAAILGALFRDINADPKSRRVFRLSSSRVVASQPTASRTSGDFLSAPSATASTPTTSLTPITSIPQQEPSSQPVTNGHAVGLVGVSGTY